MGRPRRAHGGPPAVLSGGEKQRAAIARAVIGRPDILLADEPTGNVDPELSLRLVSAFCRTQPMGTTIILATHELPLLAASLPAHAARRRADRVR